MTVRLRILRLACLGMMSALSTACSVQQHLQTLRLAMQGQQNKVEQDGQVFARSLSDQAARIAAQDVAKPWLVGKARPLAREISLPEALQGNVDTTLLFAGRASLPVLAERLSKATGIPVRIRPEALLPADLFLPRLALEAPLETQAGTQVELVAGARPLPQTLDALAARLGISWRYHQDAIDFYRTETRVFDVRALTLSSQAEARLGRSATQAANGFENTASSALASGEINALAAVSTRLSAFLTRAGVIAEHAGGGSSLVITDTPEVLDRIGQLIERENRALTRRVRLVFEEITVQAHESSTGGIDWAAVYASAKATMAWLVPAAAGPLAGSLEGAIRQGPYQGAKAIISALNQVGTVVRHSSVPILTLNRRPVTHAVRTTFSYIDQVQSTSAPASGDSGAGLNLPAVSISQKQETVGTFLTLLPDAQEDGQVLLSIAYDNTVAQPLKSITFGERDNQLQVQQITIDGKGTVQQVELQPGQAMIISGFDRRQSEFERRRLTANAPMLAGGLDSAASERSTTLLLLTAQVEEGY